MGVGSYVVRGLGNEAAFNSASHGAGRKMSRTKARKTFTHEQLRMMAEYPAETAGRIMDPRTPHFKPGTSCPPLRPDPPNPICLASSTTGLCPSSARCSAVLRPA